MLGRAEGYGVRRSGARLPRAARRSTRGCRRSPPCPSPPPARACPCPQRAKFKKVQKYVLVPHWPHARRVDVDFIRLWWLGAGATLIVIIAGSVCLGTRGVSARACAAPGSGVRAADS